MLREGLPTVSARIVSFTEEVSDTPRSRDTDADPGDFRSQSSEVKGHRLLLSDGDIFCAQYRKSEREGETGYTRDPWTRHQPFSDLGIALGA